MEKPIDLSWNEGQRLLKKQDAVAEESIDFSLNGDQELLEKQKAVEKKHRELLSNMGYETDSVGAEYFIYLLWEIRALLHNHDYDENRSIVHQGIDSRYLESCKFVFEANPKEYMAALESFCESRKMTRKRKKFYRSVMGSEEYFDVGTTLIRISRYFNDLDPNEIVETTSDKRVLEKK